MSDYLRHRLIQISTHRINWNQVLQSMGIDTVPVRQLCFVDNTQMALAMAASGYGIALARAPTTDAFTVKPGLKPCPGCPGIKSTEAYYLVYQNLESLSAAAKNFRQWLLEQTTTANG
jgi:DNA-binding transcriptional LysR family regulator